METTTAPVALQRQTLTERFCRCPFTSVFYLQLTVHSILVIFLTLRSLVFIKSSSSQVKKWYTLLLSLAWQCFFICNRILQDKLFFMIVGIGYLVCMLIYVHASVDCPLAQIDYGMLILAENVEFWRCLVSNRIHREEEIGQLFVAAFGSTMLFGSLAGSFANKQEGHVSLFDAAHLLYDVSLFSLRAVDWELIWFSLVFPATSNAWFGTTILVTSMESFMSSRGIVAGILKAYAAIGGGVYTVSDGVFPKGFDFQLGSVNAFCCILISFSMACIGGFLYMPVGRSARSCWVGTDQISSNLWIISCSWFSRMILYVNYIISVFTSLFWIHPLAEILVKRIQNAATSSKGLVDNVGMSAPLPLLFWSGHCRLARQMTLLIAFCDYLGNCIKDVVLAPRPSCPPVRRITATKDEEDNAMEYGLPSSLTLNTVCLSGYLLHYVSSSLVFDESIRCYGFALACLLVALIAFGRIYLDEFITSKQSDSSLWTALSFLLVFAYPTPEQSHLYNRGGRLEGIFRINGENAQEEYIREELNKGIIQNNIDVHCLASLIKAWFRELPSGVELVKLLPSTEASLLDWTIQVKSNCCSNCPLMSSTEDLTSPYEEGYMNCFSMPMVLVFSMIASQVGCFFNVTLQLEGGC